MSDLVIIDTDILIDVSRNADKSVHYLELLEKSHSLAISSMTQMELIVGCRNKQDLATKNQRDYRFIENLKLLPY